MTKRILLVDDDAHLLETAHDILEAAGYDVRSAESGSAALQKLKAAPVHLMIVDYNLDDTTGVELALKARALFPDIVIFLMTGEINIDLAAAKSAIQAVLTKPVNPAELISMIKRMT